jgi:hypothetical protein
MPLNQPYDPRYNAKIYVPKLTEEQRRARATPLENLRGLRFRSEAPAAPVEVPVPAESVPQAPAQQDIAAPQDVPMLAPARDYVPTAQEVVFAEFPEIFARQGKQPLADVLADEECLVSARCIPLVPRLCLGTPSPELRSAAPPNKSGPQRRRSAPPGQRLRV